MATAEQAAMPEKRQDGISKDDLANRLDELLETYLLTVDAYEQAQRALSSHLSSGYIGLAQANFSNTSGLRYGQDYYDDRMVASRQVTLTDMDSKMTFSVDVLAPPGKPNKEATVPGECTRTHPSTVPAGFETATSPKSDPIGPSPENVIEEKHVVPSQDPLRWFGILVPSALRSAQSSFVSAIEGPVPNMATLSKRLRQQEIEIGRLRKQLRKL